MSQRINAVHPNVAADRLGVSVDCVYDRIRRGELAVRRDGDRWMVILDLPDAARPDREPVRRHEPSPPPALHPQAPPTPPPDPTLHLLTRQLAQRADELNEIRTQLAALQASVQELAAANARPQPAPPPVRDTVVSAAEPRQHPLRQRPRLLALSAITALVLGGSAIQASAAQRADDLTVAFVFACGTITGAIATWLALDKRQAPKHDAVPIEPPRPVAQHIAPSLHASDGDI